MEFKKGDKVNFYESGTSHDKEKFVPKYDYEASLNWAKENGQDYSQHCVFETITDNPLFIYDGTVMETFSNGCGIELVVVQFKDPRNLYNPLGILAFEKNGLILIEEIKKEEVINSYQIW